MKRLIPLLLSVALLLCFAPAAHAAAFPQLAPDAWYADAIRTLNRAELLWLEENETAFPPDAPLTAGDLSRLVALLTASEEAAPADPEAPVSREAMAAALLAAAGEESGDPMSWAVEAGLLQGYPDGTLQPQRTITWAEAAVLAQRFFTRNRLLSLNIRTLADDGRTWYCLQDICRSGGIAVEEQGDCLLLRESGLTVELRLGDPYLRRDGLLMNSMTAAPMAQGGLVWVSPEVLSRLFTGGKAVTPSLYRAVYFYEEEVLAAIADPETEHNRLVLEQVSLPTSMGIELVRVDRSRIFQDTPVADLSPLFASDLEYWGFADPGSLCYTEYTVAESAQTLQTLLDKLYAEDPDLAPYSPFESSYDPALWTLGEYNRCTQGKVRDPWLAAGLDRSNPADAERIRFLEERDILPDDLSTLKKAFYNEYMSHTDEELREAIEARYQLELFGPGA